MGKHGNLTSLKLVFIRSYLRYLNAFLAFLELVLFSHKPKDSKNILVFKVGNIGDAVCAMPSLLAIRQCFKSAHITLLTSPGKYGAPGAKELFDGSDLFDEILVYYSEEIGIKEKRKAFLKKLRGKKYELFIQLPEDLASFRTLLRNIFFAKLIGAKSAIGFRINTTQIFKKAQVDNLVAPQETERLLRLLANYGIFLDKVEFRFNIPHESIAKVQKVLSSKFGVLGSKLLIAINPGGKRETNCWKIERYQRLAEYLYKKYQANIIVLGATHEKVLGDEVLSHIPRMHALNACGVLSLLETAELLRSASLLISNSTGTIHLGAAVGAPCVGLYTIRDIPGKWSPYGGGHRILYRLNFSCNYNSEECIKQSIDSITQEEARDACDAILQNKQVKSDK